jgi:hypothetical protein
MRSLAKSVREMAQPLCLDCVKTGSPTESCDTHHVHEEFESTEAVGED